MSRSDRGFFKILCNVKGFIDGIYIKTLPISKIDRIKNFFNDRTIYKLLLPPIRNKNFIIGDQGLLIELGGNESKEIYIDYNNHLSSLNETLLENNLLFKGYIFVDSLGNKYEFKIKKKGFDDFIMTKKQLFKLKNNFKS